MLTIPLKLLQWVECWVESVCVCGCVFVLSVLMCVWLRGGVLCVHMCQCFSEKEREDRVEAHKMLFSNTSREVCLQWEAETVRVADTVSHSGKRRPAEAWKGDKTVSLIPTKHSSSIYSKHCEPGFRLRHCLQLLVNRFTDKRPHFIVFV